MNIIISVSLWIDKFVVNRRYLPPSISMRGRVKIPGIPSRWEVNGKFDHCVRLLNSERVSKSLLVVVKLHKQLLALH